MQGQGCLQGSQLRAPLTQRVREPSGKNIPKRGQDMCVRESRAAVDAGGTAGWGWRLRTASFTKHVKDSVTPGHA